MGVFFMLWARPSVPVRFGRCLGPFRLPDRREVSYVPPEDDVEGLGQVAGDVPVVVDADSGEERLVELTTDRVRRGDVCGLGVGGERQRRLQVHVDEVVLIVGRREPLLDLEESSADSLLLALEEVEWDGVRVVGLEELLTLGEQSSLALEKLLLFAGRLLAQRPEFLAERCLKRVSFLGGELVDGVVVDDLLLDQVDQDGTEAAVLAFVVATGADEVRIDAA